MSLISLNNGWKRFDNGRIWRCMAPHFMLEMDREGNTPNYLHLPASLSAMRKVKSFYNGKLSFGTLNNNGNGVDLMVANSMAESGGSAPTQFSYEELSNVYKNAGGVGVGDRLAVVVDYVKTRNKNLVRKEPGYIDPISTPSKLSMGAHHCLISTALNLTGIHDLHQKASPIYTDAVKELVFKLPSSSVFTAQLAITYFTNSFAKHQNQPPLMAAIYNAGSLRPDATNAWNLKQYGNHLDRWVAFYNTSRLLALQSVVTQTPVPPTAAAIPGKIMEIKVVRKEFTTESTIGEMYINEEFHCYTLEDMYRSNGVKIYGVTAIPEGRYQVRMTFSNHFKKEMPLLINVPGYEGVRIHPGNTAADTLGCVLVGKHKSMNHISGCAEVYESLAQKIKAVTTDGKCHITIQKG